MDKYDWGTFIAIKEIISTVIAIILIILLFGIVIYKANETAYDRDVMVIGCEKVSDDIYEVCVEDTDGNEWAYYDSMPREYGVEMVCTFGKGNEIINAEIKVFSD